MSHDALHSTFYSPADVAEKVVVDSGEDCNLLLQLFPTLSERLKHTLVLLRVQTHTFQFHWNKMHLCGIGVQRVGAVQEVLVLSPGDHRLRKLTQVQFEQRRHRVDICITAGNDTYTPCKWHTVHTQQGLTLQYNMTSMRSKYYLYNLACILQKHGTIPLQNKQISKAFNLSFVTNVMHSLFLRLSTLKLYIFHITYWACSYSYLHCIQWFQDLLECRGALLDILLLRSEQMIKHFPQ